MFSIGMLYPLAYFVAQPALVYVNSSPRYMGLPSKLLLLPILQNDKEDVEGWYCWEVRVSVRRRRREVLKLLLILFIFRKCQPVYEFCSQVSNGWNCYNLREVFCWNYNLLALLCFVVSIIMYTYNY
ncbi:hypothetical protein HanPI659440_Chr05g0193271 [Helianthus annuus]|nr:hypothetical protein HanPI659440_Chr05g0193271 [Helianthus annuus]